MTPESEALLNALVPAEGAITTDETEAIYGLIEPVHAILDRMDAHLLEIDKLRRAADRAEDDPKVYGWFERFKQSVDHGRRLTTEAKKAMESVSDLCFQLDRYALEMRNTLTERERRQEEIANLKVVLTKTEHDALKATVAHLNTELAKALRSKN